MSAKKKSIGGMVCLDFGILTKGKMSSLHYKGSVIHHIFVSKQQYYKLLDVCRMKTKIGLEVHLLKFLSRDNNLFIREDAFAMSWGGIAGTIHKDCLGYYFVIAE